MALPRYPKNPNRVTLDFDPITSDALTSAAKLHKCTRERLAYEFVQRGLGIGVSVPAAPAPAPEPDDHTRNMQRGLDAIRSHKPQGSA